MSLYQRVDKGEALGARLVEIFDKARDEFFSSMGEDLRASEYAKSKELVRRFVLDVANYITSQVPEFQ